MGRSGKRQRTVDAAGSSPDRSITATTGPVTRFITDGTQLAPLPPCCGQRVVPARLRRLVTTHSCARQVVPGRYLPDTT
jgi:hypothetical protein